MWKSVVIAIIGGFVGAVLVFIPTYYCYYKDSLGLVKQQVEGVHEQIKANSGWEHYNGLRVLIHQKWSFLHSDDYDEMITDCGPASIYDVVFERISEHCDKVRGSLNAENYTQSWELVEECYDLLKVLPGALSLSVQDLERLGLDEL